MFDEAWRIGRDWFYDSGMHGLDWAAMGERYRRPAALGGRSHRPRLSAERAGRRARSPGTPTSSAVRRTESSGSTAACWAPSSRPIRPGRYRISKIFGGENWDEDLPLAADRAGVEVAEGSFLLAIDGVELTTADNPYRLLEGKADQLVELTVNSTAERGRRPHGARPHHRERDQPALPRLGQQPCRAGREALRRPHRLHPPAQHRRRRQPGAAEALLQPGEQGRPRSSTTATTAAASFPIA